MHGFDGGWGMGWMAVWWILGPLLIALLAWAAFKGSRRRGSSESAEEVLRLRYARGELDEETFQRMLGELRRP